MESICQIQQAQGKALQRELFWQFSIYTGYLFWWSNELVIPASGADKSQFFEIIL